MIYTFNIRFTLNNLRFDIPNPTIQSLHNIQNKLLVDRATNLLTLPNRIVQLLETQPNLHRIPRIFLTNNPLLLTEPLDQPIQRLILQIQRELILPQILLHILHNIHHSHDIMLTMPTLQKHPSAHHLRSAVQAHDVVLGVGIDGRLGLLEQGHCVAAGAGYDGLLAEGGRADARVAQAVPAG